MINRLGEIQGTQARIHHDIGGGGWEWNAFTYCLVAFLTVCVLIVVCSKLLDLRDARRVKAAARAAATESPASPIVSP